MKILIMKTALFFIFLALSTGLYAQNQPPKLMASAGIGNIFGKGLGMRLVANLQHKRVVYSTYLTFKLSILNRSPNRLLQDYQVGVLGGYDLSPITNLTIAIQSGLCHGESVWRGKRIGSENVGLFGNTKRPVFETEHYTYIGIPVSLNANWYFCRFAGLNVTSNVIFQPHIDYYVGVGIVLGYFGKKPSKTSRSKKIEL